MTTLLFTENIFSIFLIICLQFLTSCKPYDYIGHEFKWLEKHFPNLGDPIQEDLELYRVYALTDDQMEKFLSSHFNEEGYTDWEPYQNNKSLSLHTPVYQLSGQSTPIHVCYKNDGSYKFDKKHNFIAMFIETERKRLVLVYGITFGR